MMEFHSPNVVQVPKQGEDASPQLVVPHLDLVIVTARNKQRLRHMEADATHWTTFMFLELLNHRLQPVIPELYCSIVKTGQDPGKFWVETQTFDAITLRLALDKHCC
jgi:hypothetical protein